MSNFARFFEESASYAFSTELKTRNVDLDALVRWSDIKVVALTGVRRSGKSSLLMLMAQHLRAMGKKVAYINAEDSRLNRDTLLEDAIRWFGDSGYLIVDEITSAVDWSGWLARNHDLLKGRLRLIVSSSRSGLMEPPKELRGRVRAIEISPLSFSEYLNFNDVPRETTTAGRGLMEQNLLDYLRYGGFPEISRVAEPLEKVIIINDYFQQILALDVGEAAGEDVAAIKLFGRYALSAPYFSASRCLNYFKSVGYKIGKEKILRLEHYSQDAYLFFFLSAFGASVKDRSVHPRKAYPSDPGFLYAAGGMEDRAIVGMRRPPGIETPFGTGRGNIVLDRQGTDGSRFCYPKRSHGESGCSGLMGHTRSSNKEEGGQGLAVLPGQHRLRSWGHHNLG